MKEKHTALSKSKTCTCLTNKKEAVNVYKTDEQEHPGVKKLFSRGNTYVGGPITLIKKASKQFLNLHLNR